MDTEEVTHQPTHQPRWLTDEQITEIIDNASADDIIEALAMYPEINEHGLEISREIFNRSADRLGMSNGTTALQMVRAKGWREFTQQLRGLISESPKVEASDLSPDSADSGE